MSAFVYGSRRISCSQVYAQNSLCFDTTHIESSPSFDCEGCTTTLTMLGLITFSLIIYPFLTSSTILHPSTPSSSVLATALCFEGSKGSPTHFIGQTPSFSSSFLSFLRVISTP